MPQESPTTQGLFVTGTDTGVGKTEVSAALADLFARQGTTVHPRKPVESGCPLNHLGESLFPQDGYTLQQASQTKDPLSLITPHRFEPALSPERAAALANQPLTLEMLQQGCSLPDTTEENALLLIEGAGGFYSPIAEQKLNAHLASALGLPVVLVAEERLGCVNQVLLTHHAIRSQGLSVAFVVLNHHQQTLETAEDPMHNHDAIASRIDEPVLSISTQHTEQPWREISQELEDHWALIHQSATQ